MSKGIELAALLATVCVPLPASPRTPQAERLAHQIENMRLELARLQQVCMRQGYVDKYQAKQFERTEATRQRLLGALQALP